jgi:hypothetical protein
MAAEITAIFEHYSTFNNFSQAVSHHGSIAMPVVHTFLWTNLCETPRDLWPRLWATVDELCRGWHAHAPGPQ